MPYENSREDPSHAIGPECPEVQSAVENDSQISSNLGSYEPEEEIETPDKIEYSLGLRFSADMRTVILAPLEVIKKSLLLSKSEL